MTTPEISYQEQARRGQDIYDAQIRGQLGAEDLDKFVMIDVLTRDYEIGLNRAETALRLLERRPRAVIHAIPVTVPIESASAAGLFVVVAFAEIQNSQGNSPFPKVGYLDSGSRTE